jgi:hypothetical protein
MDGHVDRGPGRRYLAVILPAFLLWILVSSTLQALRQLGIGLQNAERAATAAALPAP